MSLERRHSGSVLWSVALHVAVIAAIAIGLPLRERPRVAVPTAPIQGVIIDSAAIEREEREQREEAARVEQQRQRQQREERERREQAEQQKRVAEQREQERVAAEKREREREEAEQRERERVAAEKREQQEREQQARAEREKREKEAAERREREAAQKRREAELAAALAAEAERAEARASDQYEQYILMITNRIKSNWDRPLSARLGIDCVVQVVQLPTGDVVSARVASCNGDDAVRRSIERAVMDASPLPRAPTPALFERSLNVTFRPDE
jgi:colicin import membrane protein